MKSSVASRFVLALAFAFVLTVSAHPGQDVTHRAQTPRSASARSANNMNKPVKLIGAILVPGNPLRFDISWVDQATARYYLAEGGNGAVDVFDGENDFFLCWSPV